jgi:hypothetical protein
MAALIVPDAFAALAFIRADALIPADVNHGMSQAREGRAEPAA